MSFKNPLGRSVALILFFGIVPCALAQPANDKPELFGLTRVWSIHLEISAQEFQAMQPPQPGGFGPPPPAPPAAAGNGLVERSLFGTEFRWVKGDFSAEGQTLKNVGVRYAGDITYLVSAAGIKRPLKIAFDKFDKQKFGGLSAVQLHAMPLDPAKAREALANSLFRACGVPASRTAFAEVTLTVPGRHDKEYLGLYTLVEDLDASFLIRHFDSEAGLALKPFGIRGVDFLGENWEAYKGQYRPQRDAAAAEQQRVIAFAKLVNSASDEEFQQQILSFIDIDAFLRYMAANALTANLESFLALGHNYTLYLDPKSQKFHFIPGDLEFSFANLLLFGTPEQLLDLSVMKPYPGENKLPDRLLSSKDIAERYRKLLGELSTTVFTKDKIVATAAAIDKATATIRDKEQKAAAARPAAPAGFGPPPGAGGPQPPDLATFAEKRTKSIASQLAGVSKGFVPQPFNFGPPPGAGNGGRPGGGNIEAINETTFRESVHVPKEFEATLFAAPPKVSYPVAIACEPSGAVYVAVDEQGSLGRTSGGGRILRCVDKDDDGKVDTVTIFAKVEHPRGVMYRDGKVWVMHPPQLSVFHDEDGDGVADSEELLVSGLTTDQITNRGGDHTTNCVRMGIDGWLYIGVGDYGIKEAKGKDDRTIVLRGGGVVRVRPDGTELEIYCTGLRNPFDLGIDPFLNMFTRDNTNDGAGWDTRVSLLRQSALYGYTQLFANFTDEIMPTLGTFGNSGGTGSLFLQDPRWPEPYRNTLLTGDWGRSEVYRHDLAANGPTFDLKQEVFVQIPRATGMDIDGRGRLYVASWRSGEAAVYVGPNVGFVARVTPKGLVSGPFPDLKDESMGGLVRLLAAPQSVTRLHAQGEILHRGKNPVASKNLLSLASDGNAALEARVAAIFTLKQLDGKGSHPALLKLAVVPAVREFVLRALTDRISELEGLDLDPFVDALSDASPRVRAQALISLGRLNYPAAAKSILPLTMREPGSAMPLQRPLQNQPDPGRVVPHLAVRALTSLHASDACLEALDGPYAEGALWAMRYMHNRQTVEGLIKRLGTARAPELRRGILVTLIRLYNREADYVGSWWGIRPDNSGPYFDRVQWEMSARIGAVLTTAIKDSDLEAMVYLKRELTRHGVVLAGIPNESELVSQENEVKIVLPKADPANPNQLANMSFDAANTRALAKPGDAQKGEALFKSQSCVACHTTADGQTPKGPHLFEIGKRYKPAELVESILKPSVKLAQGYETYQFVMVDGKVVSGFVVSERADSTIIREADGRQRELKKSEVEEKVIQKISAMPEGIVANLSPEQLADLIAYLQSLK
jgi:putative membrane-bound dehydrogenase-like protein